MNIWAELSKERLLWGPQNHDPMTWLAIILEELGEAAKAALEAKWEDYPTELIQAGACIVAAVECFNRNQKGKGEKENG